MARWRGEPAAAFVLSRQPRRPQPAVTVIDARGALLAGTRRSSAASMCSFPLRVDMSPSARRPPRPTGSANPLAVVGAAPAGCAVAAVPAASRDGAPSPRLPAREHAATRTLRRPGGESAGRCVPGRNHHWWPAHDVTAWWAIREGKRIGRARLVTVTYLCDLPQFGHYLGLCASGELAYRLRCWPVRRVVQA